MSQKERDRLGADLSCQWEVWKMTSSHSLEPPEGGGRGGQLPRQQLPLWSEGESMQVLNLM